MEQLTLSDLIYLHKLYGGALMRGMNANTRTIEALIEARLKELAETVR